MAYTDPKPMTTSRLVSIVVVVAIHALLLWWMFNGGYAVTKKLAEDMKVIDVKEPPPPPEKLPPPPPPDNKLPPPPVVSPPPIVQTQTVNAPVVVSQPTPPPVYVPAPTAPVITPPAPPSAAPIALQPRGSPQSWMTTDDYPPSALRDGVEGTVGTVLLIGADGKVTSCSVTSSSGSSLLDDTSCRLLTRRARFQPGKDSAGNAIGGQYRFRFSWKIPKE